MEFDMLGHIIRLPRAVLPQIALYLIATAYFSLPRGEESADATGIVDSIARASGMSDLKGLSMIEFTFSARTPDAKIKRHWQWFPKTDDVICTGKDPSGKQSTVTYSRKTLADMREEAPVHTIDGWFTSDLYWLLFPYYLKNDAQKRMTRENSAVMPISGKWATCIKVEYYKPDPKRPGDKFNVYVDSTYHIKEWVVYPYESFKAVAVNKWESYKPAGPFMISLDRPSKDNKGIQVKISEVKVAKGG
jgi:hypothetical protein